MHPPGGMGIRGGAVALPGARPTFKYRHEPSYSGNCLRPGGMAGGGAAGSYIFLGLT